MRSIQGRFPEFCLGLCLVCLAPLVWLQAVHLWERPHFQFFPLAWLAFGALITTRSELKWSSSLGRRRLGSVVWAAGVLAGLAGALLFSPWLGQAACVLCISGWGWLRLATVPPFRWFGWSLLLWITVPLPGQLDANLINGLQRISAESAGGLLDLIGIAHLRQGTLIEIRAGKLFVDEACSGIDSLYSLVAIALLMMLWQARPLVVGFFTVITVPIWAWLGNVLRLTTIVICLDRWQVDLSHGWQHTALGFVTFGLSALCLFLTLDALTHLFRRFSTSDLPRDRRQWHLWYNAVVCFPGRAPVLIDEEQQYFEVEDPRLKPKPKSKVERQSTVPAEPKFGRWVVGLMTVSCLIAAGLSIRNIARDWRDGSSTRLPHFDQAQVKAAIAENGLPEAFEPAKRLAFRHEHRSPDNFLGEHSAVWTYRAPSSDFVCSIDFPFRGYHPLWVCYTNAGQQIQGVPTPVSLPSQADQPQSSQHVVQVKLKDELGNLSYLWFLLFDAQGQPAKINLYDQENDTNPILERLKLALADSVEREPVTYQFQMYVPSSRELSEAEIQSYLKLFDTAIPMAIAQVQKLD
ncbi:MAG: exosortase U [Pirellulaceae bacterium]|nr:exosortase U [Pirellulaceae bacterium]